jgi:hypothetical protein
MGMTHKISETHRMRRYISSQAIQRLREKIPDASNRTDADLMRWLDDAVEDRFESAQERRGREQEIELIVDLSSVAGVPLMAMIKDGERGGQAVVTVFTPDGYELRAPINEKAKAVLSSVPPVAQKIDPTDERLVTWEEDGEPCRTSVRSADLAAELGRRMAAADHGTLRAWRPVRWALTLEEP